MWIEKDECVGCPDGCRQCGRKHKLVQVCDGCQEERPRYVVGNDAYCQDCLEELMYQEGYDDIEVFLDLNDGYEMED